MPLYIAIPENEFTRLFTACRNTIRRDMLSGELPKVCMRALCPDHNYTDPEIFAALDYLCKLALKLSEKEINRLESYLRDPKRRSLFG